MQGRQALIGELNAKVRAGEVSFEDAEADLAQKDANVRAQYQANSLHIERLSIEAEKAKMAESARVQQVRSSLKPVIEANPLVPASIIEMYANAGEDPAAIAAWYSTESKPVFDAAIRKAVADAQAPKDAEITSLKEEIARLKKVQTNNAAAAPTIASRADGSSGSTAPSMGTDAPLLGKFGWKQIANQKMGRV